jgi:hypothetical protein
MQEIGTSMLTTAFDSQRHLALIDAQPGITLTRAAVEPCLDSTCAQADRRLGRYAAPHACMWNEVEDGFGSRGFRGMEAGVLTRKVPA